MSDTRLCTQRASLGWLVITSLAHHGGLGQGGEFSFCDYLCFFLFSKPKVLVKDDLKSGSFGGMLSAYPTCLELCFKKKKKEAIIKQYCREVWK